MASTTSTTMSAMADKLKMQAHPEVSVTLAVGALTNVGMKILNHLSPEWGAVLQGSEAEITLLAGALAGYLTKRAAR